MAPTGLELAEAAIARRADKPLLHYFTTPITGGELAAQSDALACALAARGIAKGDRVAVYLQNVPQLPIAVIAAWKLGAMVVPINPMLRERELELILTDSEASVLICLEELRERVPPSTATITASPLGSSEFAELVEAHRGERPPAATVAPDDVAFVVYTSGTTGPPKGAMNLHRNVVFASCAWRDCVRLGESDVNLALAPLFHVTGLIAGLGASLAAAAPLVLGYRFDPATTLELIEAHRPTFTVAAITAYAALMQAPGFEPADLSALRAPYTGGAPVPPAIADAWREATGARLHNAYGLTETTSPLTLTPLGVQGPVDPASGTLSVGKPVPGSTVEVLGDDGAPLPAGEIGEIVAAGPQVVPGYWRKPQETATALPDGRLRTGDVGFIDADGWVYLVDRRKDLIIASGYKIWPREVEDVLYGHPAVREAAVIGVPDAYRGETVRAYVSLHADAAAAPGDLIEYCRERMAAYKYPRAVELVDELPKNASGKILRRELRDRAAGGA